MGQISLLFSFFKAKILIRKYFIHYLKLIIVAVLFLSIIGFASCKGKPAQLIYNFSGNFTAKCNSVEIKGKALINKNNVISLKLTYPESMSGYSYSYKGDNLIIKYDNMVVDTQSGYLPQTAFPSIVSNVFRSLSIENNCYLSKENDLYGYYKGRCGSGEYNIKALYTTGVICEISISNIDFTIKFKDVKLL